MQVLVRQRFILLVDVAIGKKTAMYYWLMQLLVRQRYILLVDAGIGKITLI